jgi:signal peptidase I
VICCDAQEHLVINGVSLDEPYIYRDADGNQDPAADRKFDIVVPKDRLWVMGDHRSASGDSLEHYEESTDVQEATITEKSVVGRAFTVFWPVSRAKWLSVPDGFDKIPDASAAK